METIIRCMFQECSEVPNRFFVWENCKKHMAYCFNHARVMVDDARVYIFPMLCEEINKETHLKSERGEHSSCPKIPSLKEFKAGLDELDHEILKDKCRGSLPKVGEVWIDKWRNIEVIVETDFVLNANKCLAKAIKGLTPGTQYDIYRQDMNNGFWINSKTWTEILNKRK